MKIVLGLGNPGARYRSTRHNMGFRVADVLARRFGADLARRDEVTDLARIAQVVIAGQTTLLAQPRTFMNRSGRAALALCGHFRSEAGDLLVVHDDADLELGRVRIRTGGSAGGHNGIRSLISVLGTEEFPRVKLGVRGAGRDGEDLAEYVLEEFDADEHATAEALALLGADAVETVIAEGIEAAMRRFNPRRAGADGPSHPGSGC